jgi:peptidoglycan hydrolase FlgJ
MTPPPLAPTPMSDAIRTATLRTKAEELEASFLSEMLSYTGMDKSVDSFGGGHGEEQFTSFLRQEHATAMVAAGGIGLAEQLFKSLTAHQGPVVPHVG